MTVDAGGYLEEIAGELTTFADIGTAAPTWNTVDGEDQIFYVRNGEPTSLTLLDGGNIIIERYAGEEIKHAGMESLLASERYGSLRQWAQNQSAFLNQEYFTDAKNIDVWGHLNGSIDKSYLSGVDQHLNRPQNLNTARVLLIDGPAGIGKTHFVLQLAQRRASVYVKERKPLILHVQSRGRTLSYLYDLIAFSLQRLRIGVTYDQAPVLAKYGLITIAIDGFDELADPDGYDLAWGQVSELVASLRGKGRIILSGRETFIGRDRVLNDITSLRKDDEISVLTLQPPQSAEAMNWLREQGWEDDYLDAVDKFLEPSSLALRPFFLRTLATREIAKRLSEAESSNVLAILIDAMIDREIGKFGDNIEAGLSVDEWKRFIRGFMGEVARDMAENSSASISDATLSFMVDVALPEGTEDTVRRTLKARSQHIAFLTNDDRRGYRRFYHDKFYEYFLCRILIDVVSNQEASKFLSRGIIGGSLLETFSSVVIDSLSSEEAGSFIAAGLELVRESHDSDRTRRNIAALLLAASQQADLVGDFEIHDVSLDEVRLMGTSERGVLRNVSISQMDCRSTDLSNLEFDNCSLITMIADEQTRLPDSAPRPQTIQDVALKGEIIVEPDRVSSWIEKHLANPPEQPTGLVPQDLRDHPAVHLLFKACRMRQYWLRSEDDKYAERILNDPNWSLVEETLKGADLLREEFRDASGRNARFIHIRQEAEILAENADVKEVDLFFENLVAALRADTS